MKAKEAPEKRIKNIGPLLKGLQGFPPAASEIFPSPLHHGLYGDADAGQRLVPPGLGRGHHQLRTANVAGHSLRGKHHRHLPDHLGGHLDDLRGPEHRADPV